MNFYVKISKIMFDLFEDFIKIILKKLIFKDC